MGHGCTWRGLSDRRYAREISEEARGVGNWDGGLFEYDQGFWGHRAFQRERRPSLWGNEKNNMFDPTEFCEAHLRQPTFETLDPLIPIIVRHPTQHVTQLRLDNIHRNDLVMSIATWKYETWCLSVPICPDRANTVWTLSIPSDRCQRHKRQ